MLKKIDSIKKICVSIFSLYVILVLLITGVAWKQIRYDMWNQPQGDVNRVGNIGEIVDGMVIEQKVKIPVDVMEKFRLYISTFDRKNTGEMYIQLLDGEDESVFLEKTVDISELENNQFLTVFEENEMQGKYKENYILRITTDGCSEGNAVTIAYEDTTEDVLSVNEEEKPGMALSMQINGILESHHYYWYFIVIGVVTLLLGIYLLLVLRADKKGKVIFGMKYMHLFLKYKFLMMQLISRDFNTKYKKSVLGVMWSLLNPILTMTVQYVVFSHIFRFQIENYAVYLLTGIVFFNGMSETTTNGLYSIVGNAGLITKVYVPKYIYPVSKVLSASINTVLSLIPLIVVALFTGLPLTPAMLLIPIGLVFLIVFEIGLSMVLASGMVFFRDVQFLWSVFTMMWMYLTPILYPLSTLPAILQKLMKFNPMYYFIEFFRTLVIDGCSPAFIDYAFCGMWSLGMLLVGMFVFKKTQDKFILYI